VCGIEGIVVGPVDHNIVGGVAGNVDAVQLGLLAVWFELLRVCIIAFRVMTLVCFPCDDARLSPVRQSVVYHPMTI
jgi:hypothetical protein